MSAIIGLDPSMTKFGVCRIQGGNFELKTIESEVKGVTWEKRLERYKEIASAVAATIRETDQPIFTESYSFGSKNSRAHTTGEFGCYLRLKLTQTFKVPVIEITPTELKKWVAGSGNANKFSMVSSISLQTNLKFADDNQADACGLAMIGECVVGLKEPSNDTRRKILSAIRERHGLLLRK